MKKERMLRNYKEGQKVQGLMVGTDLSKCQDVWSFGKRDVDKEGF